ncbi:MAG: hypothetical protein VXZ82_08660 [Planctomycetota bacterium]|nr:hypothetical protein [Planctomycetota bacterium]
MSENNETIEDLPDEETNQILDAIYSGQKILAVKIYKEARNIGLAEAKQFIEQLTDELRQKHPERFSQSKSGCLGLLILFSASLATTLTMLR